MKHFTDFLCVTNPVIEQMISDFISGKNAERDRQILRRRLIDGITYERLSEEFELSTNHIKRILYTREIELLRAINYPK